MLYIDKSLLESLGQICNGTIPAGYNKKPVYVRIGDKVFKYGTGSFSFVTLMALTACGGTSGGGGGGGGGTGGVGLKGPIQGAVAFIDLNNNAKLDIASEPYSFTDADGVYNIDSSASGTVVIITDGTADVVGGTLSINAVDTSSGSALTGVTLQAPAGSTVVSPTSTIVQSLSAQGVSASEVASALGLTGVDILNFNPYAAGVDSTSANAVAMEKVQAQIMTTVKSLSAAAAAEGANAGAAANQAFSSMATVVKTKSDAGQTMDLKAQADLDSIVNQALTDMTTGSTALAGINVANFTDVTDSLKGANGALKAVNAAIDGITDLSAANTANILNAGAQLISTASEGKAGTAKLDAFDGNVTALITAIDSNNAPSALSVGSLSYTYNSATDTSVGATLTSTDADGDSVSYTVSGPDAHLVTLSGTGNATVALANPAKNRYEFVMTATDDATATIGGESIDTAKSSSENIFVTRSSNLVEDSGSYTATGSALSTGLTGTVTYSIPTMTSSGAVTGTYGSLALNTSTGAYTYTLANDSAAVQELQNVQAADFFVLSSTDSSGKATTHNIAVTVAGGEFQFDGSAIASDFKFNFGDTYVFDQSDATNDGHTLALSGSANNSSDDPITSGVTVTGTAGTAGAKTTVTIDASGQAYIGYIYGYNASTDAVVSGAGGSNHEVDFGPRTNGTNITEVLTFMIEGKLEPLTAVAPTNDTLTEGDTYTTSVTGTLTSTGILSTATAAYGIEGVSGSGDITKTGTYGTLSLNTATGVYSYALDSSDTETAALSGGDVVNETFTVTVSDGLGGSASATLTIPIQGSGINLDAVTGDDLINLAEATAGLNLTGKTNPGQTISVVLSSSGTLAGTNSTTSGSDGTFSIPITAADITAMGEGSETFTVSMDYPKTYNIKVTVDSGVFKFNGQAIAADFAINEGDTYIFDQSDASNAGHTLALSASSDNSGDDAITSGVTIAGTAGSSGASTTVVIPASSNATAAFVYGYNAETDSVVAGAGGTNEEIGITANGATVSAPVKSVSIDTTPPTSTISSVAYDSSAGTITFTGTNFGTAGADGVDIKSQIDWTKLAWDIDGDGSSTAGVVFTVADITSAVVTNDTTLTITLADNAALQATAGFAADGIGATNAADNIDVTAGFVRDAALNPATTDAASNLATNLF